jgi:hypothetical protein
MTLVAVPNTISTCPGKITLNATVKDSAGAAVPDGMVVTFMANGGELSRQTALTTKGIATVVLNLSAPPSPFVTAPIYTVAAGAAQLLSATNVQAACPYQPPPTANASVCGTGAASACPTVVPPPPPPQGPIEVQPAPSVPVVANGRIRPPSTGGK